MHRETRLAAPEKLTTSEHNDYLNNLEQQFVLQTLLPHVMQESKNLDTRLCQEMSALWPATPAAVETDTVHLSGEGMGHQGDNLSQIQALSQFHARD